MRYSLVIFDLDGTLADSLPWFLSHVNTVADRFGLTRVPQEHIEPLRSVGTREILERLDVPLWKLPTISRYMRRLKAAHMDDIALFAGADTMLAALAETGLRLSLVSSDSEINARRLLGAANTALFSDFACGASLFGKAKMFRRLLKRTGIDPARAIAIGDEVRDIEAARAAGIAAAAVTWGYAAEEALRAAGPDVVLERMEDIGRLIGVT